MRAKDKGVLRILNDGPELKLIVIKSIFDTIPDGYFGVGILRGNLVFVRLMPR